MTSKKYNLYVIILGLMVAIGPFSIDMYLPAFKMIAEEFDTTISSVALSMASYFVGMSLGQLLYGPLLDRYGRKKPLYFGLIVYIVASVACIMSTSVDQLIAFRAIQAIGGCAAGVAAFSIVRDIFPVKDIAKVFSSFMLVISASPIIAPSAGGLASAAWGWESVFVILIILTIIIVALVYFVLPLSNDGDSTYSLMPRDIIRSFADVFREPQFFTYAISGGIAFAGIFVFVSTSPFLYMKVYGLSEKQYSILFAVLVGGMIMISQSNRLLLRKYSSETLMAWAIPMQFVMSVVLLVIALLNMEGFYLQTSLLFLFLTTVGIILPNSSALSLAPFSTNTGTASSLLGMMQFGFGALASFVVSISITNSSLPMTVTMMICSSLALISLFVGRSFVKTPYVAVESQPAAH
jgi:MFS transporter, DHA1 family, multidrug resistance protein